MKNMEEISIRPYSKIAAIMILIGVVNFMLYGFTPILDSNLGGTIGGILDKVFFVAMIGSGAFVLRKRMIVGERTLRFLGLIDGKRSCKIEIAEIESIKYLHGKQRAEISTTNGSYLVRVPESSNVYLQLKLIKPQ